MKNSIIRLLPPLAAVLYALLAGTAYGQICPDETQSERTISVTPEQCYLANDGEIEISFVNALGVYDVSLGDFTPVTGDYEYNLLKLGSGGGYVYDESTLSAGLKVVPGIAVNYIAPNKITFTGVPPADGYSIVLVGGDCDGSFSSREFRQTDAFGTPVPAAPEIIIDPAQITTQPNTVCAPPAPFDGEINMNSAVSGGAGGYEYSIDGTTFQTSPIFSNLEHGTYTVTVIDQNSTTVGDNCTKTVSVIIPDGRVPPTAAITPSNPEACAAVDLLLNGNPTGGANNYVTHTWTGDVGFLSATNVVDPTFNSATPGTYSLTYEVTDDKGCTATSSVTVTVVDPIAISLIVDEDDPTICAGESTSVTVRNAQTGYRYQLRDDADNSPIGGPANGADADLTLPTGNLTTSTTFNVLVSSISGPCPDVELTDQATVTVVDAVDLTLAVSPDENTICSGESTSILLQNSELNVDYQLRNDADDSNVGPVITGNGGDISFPTGTLTFSTTFYIVADNGVCTEAELDNKATVTVNPSPTQAVLSGDATVCTGSSTDLTVAITGGVGPFSFTLVNSVDATTIPVANYTSGDNISVSPTADVTYSISGVVTDANGCEVAGTGSATITLNQGPTAASISGSATICEGETADVQLTITGGQAPYTFTLSDGTVITGYTSGTAISVSPTATTSYTVATVQDANGCAVTVGGSADVTVNPRPTPFDVDPGSLALCPGDDATITLSGSQSGVAYEIYKNAIPTGQIVSGTGSPISLTLASGSFINNDVLTVQANNSICVTPMSGSSTVIISTISAFGITSPASVTACPGDVITVSLGGSESGVTYELLKDGVGTGTLVNGTGSAINFTMPVTSGDNGSAFSVIGRRTTCERTMNGSTTATVNNLTAEAGPPQSIPENTPTLLSGSASNGSGTYTYAWTSAPANQIAPGEEANQNPNTVSLTATTTFTLEVTDTNTGCKSTDAVIISVTGGLPTVIASASPTAVCAGEAVQLTAAASGGDGTYTYAWDNGVGTGASPTVNPTVTTTYEVTVTDGNGDTAKDQVTVTVNPLPTAYNLTPSPNALVCSGADVIIALDGEDADVTYTLLQNGAEVVGNVPTSTGTGLEFVLANGSFNAGDVLSIRATDNNTGCARLMNGSATIQTNDPQPFAVTAVETDVCTGENAVVQLSGSETGVDYNVLIDGTAVATVPGDNSALIITIPFVDLVDGGSVTIEANNGSCTVAMTGSATLSISDITAANAGPDETICSDGYLFSANSATTTETGTWTVQSGSGTFVNINNPATVVNGLSPGNNVFKWTISDNNGVCDPTEDVITIFRRDVTVADAGTAQTVCEDEVVLAANAPAPGEQGTWTTTGSGVFDDLNDPVTRVTNLDVGANQFVWTISDNSGTCPSEQATVTVTRNQLSADAGTDQSVATGTTASLSGLASNGTGPYTYRWEPAALLDDPNVANPTTVALTASVNFTLTVTDQGVGSTCQRTDQVTVTVTGGLPSVIASAEGSENPITVCEGETIDLSALGSGGDGVYTYAWTSDNGTVITQASANNPQASATPTITTTFTVEVTDGNGDQATDDIVVTVNALPTVFTVGTDPTLVCSGTDATISLDGSETGTQYQLLRNNTVVAALAPVAGNGSPLTTTLPQSEFANGDVWTIQAENASGCTRMMAGQARIQISDPTVFTITTPAVLDVCPGQPATITLDNSDLGIDYVLMTGGNPVTTLTGNDAALNFVLPDGSFSDDDVYTVVANNSSCQVAMTGSVEINLVGVDATFSYASGTYCFDGSDPKPVAGYAFGGTFSAPSSISIDSDDGTIDVSASTVGGPYTITYTIGSGSCVSTESFEVSIINSTPDPAFDYSQDQYCIQAGTTPPVFAPGATAGTFSYQPSPAGPNVLALGADGSIDLATSDPGTYRVTNFIAGSGGSCADAVHEETVQIFAPDVADISYNGGSAICQSETTDPTPVFAPGSTTTGTFSVVSANPATAVMTIVTATGLIDLSDTDPGIYEVEFRTNGPCPDDTTITVVIEEATDASFTYPASSFCRGTGSVPPGSVTTGGGVFSSSAPTLLLVDSSSGVIDVDNSTAGNYFVIYETTTPGCNGRDSVAITINDITADAGTDDLACRLRYDLLGNTPATGATGEWTLATTPSGSETVTFANRFDPTTSVSVSDTGRYEFEWRVTQGGCSVSDMVVITFYNAINVQDIGAYLGTSDCTTNDGYKGLAAGGGSGSFGFEWSEGTTTTVYFNETFLPPVGGYVGYADDLSPGIHNVVITDSVTACDTTVIFTIGVAPIDDKVASAGNTVCGNSSNGTITTTSTDNTDTREYTINYFDRNNAPVGPTLVLDTNVDNDVTANGFVKGTYFLEIEVTSGPNLGCITYQEVEVEAQPAPSISVDNVTQPSCVGTTDGSLSINVSGTTPDTYTWKDSGGSTVGTTQNLSSIPVGEYSVDITYNGGTCTQTFGPYSVLPQNTSDGPTATAPLAPSIQCSSFDARWSDEGAGISYRLDVSEDALFTTPFLDNETIAANVTTFTVGGLAPGTQYFYRVRSVDGGCVSDNSNVISVTTETGNVPSGLYATGASCDQFTANWAPVPGATDYAVEVATDAAFANLLAGYNPAPVGSADNKLLITGLTGGQTYHYRISVATSCGTSAYSAAASLTTDGLSDAPTNLSATAGCTTAELNWQAVSGSVSRYEVYLDDDSDFTNGTLSATPDATVLTTTTVSLPTPGANYFFHVLAILDGCNTTMAFASFTSRSEPIPPAASASDIKCDGFTLSWPAVPDADDYVVDVSEDGFATFTTNTITDLSLEVNGLTPGTLYEYRIRARGCTESAFTSGTVTTDDTPAGLASAPTAAVPSCVGFTVSWTAQSGIRYRVEASPVGDNFTTVIEPSPEVDGDFYTFTTLAVETDYNYRVIPINDCGEGSPTNGSSFISTKLADECGCGHDQVAFTVTTSNATCPGNADGAFTILSRKKSGVTVTPDMGRFKYRYQSLTNPADTSAWEAGEPGSPPLPHFFSGVKAGDYEVLVWDTLDLPGCLDTVAFITTIGLQNEIRITAKAETCDSLGQVVVDFPEACNTPDRYYWARVGSGEANGDNKRVTISGLSAGDYQVEIFDFLTGESYDTLSVFVPNNCSTGTDTTTVCNLNGITFIPETTLAACETGEGSVTFTAINNTTETFTFTVIEEGGVVFETKEGSSGITFDNLPSRRYTYEIYDALSQSCRGKFTVGTKSVSFTATVPQTIACDDVSTSINVTVDTDATLAAGPYEVFLMDQTDTLAQTSLLLGSTTTTFADVAVGGSYEVVIVAAAEDACVARRTVDATPPGTTALQFTYALDSTACFQTRGGGKVTVQNIVVADNTPFDAYLYRVDSGEEEEYASRKFSTTPQSFVFEDIANGQYQVHLVQAQSGCVNTVQEKRSATFTIDGPEQQLAASIRSFVEVTVNYPYGTIEIDSITGGGAPYEVRIAADPSGGSTNWVEVVNENPIVRPYRHEYLDQPVGTYFVEVRDRFGCVVLKQVEVGYTAELYIPNIFTPNSDGENDTFQILNLEDFGENAGVQLIITNRWGRQVYRAKNYTNAEAWDGGNLSDGVYFYHLILPDNTIHNGWVEIWRGRTP